MNLIKSLTELKELAQPSLECFIALKGGFRSSKQLEYNKNTDEWFIVNEIDGSIQTCTTQQLENETNILDALSKNALYAY
jgi:hypothetical protein